MSYRRVKRWLITALLLGSTLGCQTVRSWDSGCPGIYSGVRYYGSQRGSLPWDGKVFFAIDLPLTMVTDTLLLPASALDKTIARLLSITVIFLGYVLIFTTLTSVVVELVNSLFFGQRNQWFHPFDSMGWSLFGHFVVIQSLYFLGAAWFRRNHFIKTTLAVTIACIGLTVLALVILRFVFVPSFDDLELWIDDLYSLYQGVIDVVGTGVTALYFVALPVMCWSVAWLRVRETQVSDGV